MKRFIGIKCNTDNIITAVERENSTPENSQNIVTSNVTDDVNERPVIENRRDFFYQIPSPLPVPFPWVETDSDEQVIMSANEENSRERGKRVPDQEQKQLTSTLCEPLPRERKRWVRPSLVEALVSDTPVIVKGASCLETIAVGESEEEEQAGISNRCVNDFHLQINETNTLPLPIMETNVEHNYDNGHSGLYNAMRKHVGNYQSTAVFKDAVDFPSRISSNSKEYFLNCKAVVTETSLLGCMNVTPISSEVVQESGARAPSPSSVSSVTSGRRLEWDSGADVGYQGMYSDDGPRLSTIERIALERGCSAAMLMRFAPEETSGPIKQYNNQKYMLQAPIAESTPVEKNEDQDKAICTSTATESEGEITPIVRQTNVLFLSATDPHSQSLLLSSRNEDDEQVICKGNVGQLLPIENSSSLLLKKYSSSMTDLSVSNDNIQNYNRSLPRSHSHLNILDHQDDEKQESTRHLPRNILLSSHIAACSVSSSSISTVVQNQEPTTMFNKHIQTLPHTLTKLSVGIQTSENLISDVCKTSKPVNEISSSCSESKQFFSSSSVISRGKTPIVIAHTNYSKDIEYSLDSNNKSNDSQTSGTLSQLDHMYSKHVNNRTCQENRCTGAHKKGFFSEDDISCKTAIQSCSRNGALKVMHIKSKSAGLSRNIENKSLQHKNQTEEFSTLESVPSSTQTAGSWYVADTPRSDTGMQRRGSAGVVGSAHSFEYLPGHIYESSGAAGIENGIIEDFSSCHSVIDETKKSLQSNEMSDKISSASSTIEKELVQGVKLLEELIKRKTYDSNMKKQLIRRVIDKLEFNYTEDRINDVHKTPLNSNVPWIPVSQQIARERIGSASSTCLKPISDAAFPYSNFTTNKDVRTVSSETTVTNSSCVTSLPTHNEDSRAETTTETSSVTMPVHPETNWRAVDTNSEQELKYCKQDRKHTQQSERNETALLNFCKTERENQLYWIRFEIDHLMNLKQLLEKQEGLKRNLTSLAAHEHKFLQPRSATVPKTERQKSPESSSSTTNRSDDKLKSVYSQRLVAPKSSGIPDVSNWASHNFALSNKGNSGRQYLAKYKDRNVKSATQKVESRQGGSTQTHTLDSIQQAGTADSALGSILDGSGKNGQINVYVQTMNQKFLQPSGKNTEIQNAKKKNIESEKSSLKCCCECRKILKDIVKNRKSPLEKSSNNSPIKTGKSICCKCKVSNLTYNDCRHITVRQSPQINARDSSATSNETSRTSGNVVDISVDSKDHSSNKITENIGVQTTASLIEMWPSRNGRQIHNKRCITLDKAVNVPSESDTVCPCCGLLEEKESEANLRVAPIDVCNMTDDVENVCCSDFTEKHAENQPVGICVRQEFTSDNNKSSQINKLCHCCGGLKGFTTKQNQKSKEYLDQKVTTFLPAASPKLSQEPLAYILTFEQESEESLIEKEERRKSLPEIKMKIPVSANIFQKQHHKGQEESLSSQKIGSSSKENERPQENMNDNATRSSKADSNTSLRKTHKLTLQEYLKVNRPDYVQCADKRRQCVADLAYLRELRHEGRQRLLTLTGGPYRPQSVTSSGGTCNKPPLSERQVFTQRRMHEQTKKKIQRLAEVQNKKSELKKKEDYRTNRLMAEIFTKKLQKKVLKGQMNLSNSVSVISTL